MLAQRQNYRRGGGYEREHGAQVYPPAGESGYGHTEPTEVITRSSGKRNGNLLFTLRPIQEVIDEYYDRQLEELELAAERQRVTNLLREWESLA